MRLDFRADENLNQPQTTITLVVAIWQQRAFLKSSTVRVRPMDSIRKPRKIVNRSLLSHVTAAGLAMPIVAPSITCAIQRRQGCCRVYESQGTTLSCGALGLQPAACLLHQ